MLVTVTTTVNIELYACVHTGQGLDSVLTFLRLYLRVLEESLIFLKQLVMCIVVFT